MAVTGDSAIEKTRRWVNRVAIAATLGLLTAGLVLFETGSTDLSTTFFRGAFFVLVAMPIAAVIVVLIEEIRGGDWTFVGATFVVLGLIAYSIFR
jgi:peptidoglycan/LPS O-acetylase OafA/YrhL